jgi:electron transport complex protein RnfB
MLNLLRLSERAQRPMVETAQRLNEMTEKGLIFSVQSAEGPIHYQAAPWAVGIYEFQVNRMNSEFLQDLDDFYETRKPRSQPSKKSIPQMRTIPIMLSIESPLEALPHDQIDELVNAHDRFAVAPCICRREARMRGKGCDAPEEACLMFGDFADFYVWTGRGRMITRSEVFELLAQADKANLVLNPTNSKFVAAICCCCGCCCGILQGLQLEPKPADAAASNFIVTFDPELCTDCHVCMDRCQMQVFTVKDDHVVQNLDRCIGCGLCVSTCASGALTLIQKPVSVQHELPATIQETWRTIALDRTGSN